MASPETSRQLTDLQPSSISAADKASGYDTLLKRILDTKSPSQLAIDLNVFLDAILGGESLGIGLPRQLFSSVVSALRSIDDSDVVTAVGQHALELQQSRGGSFEEQIAAIREILADTYETLGDHSAAAKVLQGVQLESTQRTISEDDKLRLLIRIIRNYLEDDNTLDADVYLIKAKGVLHQCRDQELKLMYQLSHARILDAQRKFLDASREYHDLSFSAVVVEDERMRALSSAITCAVLAPAGPQRSRALARLYRDERASRVREYGILEKMFLDRLIAPEEVESFGSTLAEHQRARTADGLTVLEKAVAEHNLVGISKVYEDCPFRELAEMLGQSPQNAEDFAARMIEQGRLAGWIDQVSGAIHFLPGDAAVPESALPEAAAPNVRLASTAMSKWDHNVQGLAGEVERAWATVLGEFGDFGAESLVH